MRIQPLDLNFMGRPRVIASFLVRGPGGPFLVETGPGTTLPALQAGLARHGLAPADVKDVLLTHIHLDHAGAAGWWARQGARVWVHPRGAPHLVDPERLIASASRIYGDQMNELWGEILPAPADRVQAVEDGTVIEAGGLRIEVVETPGHAGHHHAYRIDDVLFAGDSAGMLLPGQRWIDLPAPPPEFDLEAWKATLGRLREIAPRTIYRTHFGGTNDLAAELAQFEKLLEAAVEWIREMLDEGLDRQTMYAEFTRRMRRRAADAGADEQQVLDFELANPRHMSVDGIARYWRKRREA